MNQVILIVTNNAGDIHTNEVVRLIKKKDSFDVVVVDTEFFGSTWSLALNFRDKPSSFIEIEGRKIHASIIKSVWWRKPTPVNIKYMKDEMATFIFKETNDTIYGFLWILQSIGTLVINHPFQNYYASIKPKQLIVASGLSLLIEDTYITNTPDFAKDIIASDTFIAKGVSMSWAISNGKNHSIFVKEIDSEKKENLSLLRRCPATLQKRIRSTFDVRVVVVCDEVFCFRIKNNSGIIDWRQLVYSDQIHYEYFSIDADFKNKLVSYNREFKLSFSVFDFILNDRNELIFLESNPNGQWLWLDEKIGFAISNKFAQVLMC